MSTDDPNLYETDSARLKTGNPGEIDFYYHYLLAIHQATRIPVIGVSNSGHNRMPPGVSMPSVAGQSS